MGDLKVGGGLPQIPTDVKRAEEAPAPKLDSIPIKDPVFKRAIDDSGFITSAKGTLQKRMAALIPKGDKFNQKKGIARDLVDSQTSRQKTGEQVADSRGAYEDTFRGKGKVTVGGQPPPVGGYIDGLLGQKSFKVAGREVSLTGDKRAKIATIYNEAYKGTGQAKKSADEISHALQQATPQAATAQLGNIGEPLPAGVKIADFAAAHNALANFAHAIFTDEATKGLYSKEEQDAVVAQVIDRSLDCFQAMQDAGQSVNWRDAAQLVRDNLIKVHHQQTEDHKMVTGSDHGVRHIIQSNVTNTLNALDEIGPSVSPKEKLMAMQIMIDHDLGYTTDAAKGSFKSAKDHPLASTAFTELGIAQPPSSIFNEQDQAFMREAVLAHSYPFGLDQPFKFSNEAERRQSIAGIVSVVDAMGTTRDTKCPAIFREDPCLAVLKQLAHKDISEETARLRLHAAIDGDTSIPPELKESYHQAVDYDVSGFGAGMIMPQFGGTLEGTNMNQGVLSINMQISQDIADLAAVVGDQNAIKAFNKLGEDMVGGLSPDGQAALKQTLVAQEIPITKNEDLKNALGLVAAAVRQSGQPMTVPLGGISITLNP
jgi:hypothetical protein